LLILLLLFLYKCKGKADLGDVRLSLGPVGYSLWSDGSLALAIPIMNSGNRAAGDVKVAAVTLGTGTRITPATLPVALGEIVPTRRGILDARFGSLAAPGKYLLSVAGTYVLDGNVHPFATVAELPVERGNNPPPPPGKVNIPKQKTTGTPTAPSPIKQENENNPAGPPIPDGPMQTPFTVAPSDTGVAASSGAGSSVTFVRDTGTGQSGNYPPDPTVAATASAGGVVFASGNTYVLFSKDDGQTFTRIDPTTVGFPNADGGMCCDQVILYNPRVNLFFWLIQYNSSAPNPPNPPLPAPQLPGPNRLRIAWATPESMKTNINGWTFFDLTSATFNLGQQALDFPDLAFTDTFLYVSVDQVRVTGPGGVQGLIVTRIPLSDITGNGGSVGIAYYSPAESSDQNTATGARLTQNSADAMYWGGHVDSSHIKVFRWRDGNGSMDTPHDAAVNKWCKTDYSTLAPDKQQWLDNSRTSASSIIGATRKPFRGLVPPGGTPPNGEVWLAWGAGRDDPSCTQGRPQPFVKIARVDDQTLDTVGEYHIWNSAYAFAYPALATDPNGNIGVSVAFGGPNNSNYASTTVGYLGDFVVYYVEASDVTLTFTKNDTSTPPKTIVDSSGNPVLFTRYGDYFAVRNSGADGTFFSSQGYAVKLVNPATNCGTTGSGCNFRPHYVQWGRPAAPGPH
jgi:hypothetical protein